MDNRYFKGVWIPKEIWFNKELTLNEKMYLALYNETNIIDVIDIMLSSGISLSVIYRIKQHLIELKYIEIITNPEKAKRLTLINSNVGDRCEWCGKPCFVLHKHHYPIPACKGGTETVNICPNCHSTFHVIYKQED